MSSRQAAVAQATPQARAIPWVFLSYLAIGMVALLPRVLDLGGFLTGDEGNFWLERSAAFLRAIQTGNFAATAITDHPGVTTMWLGSAGIILRRALFDSGLLHDETFPIVLRLWRQPQPSRGIARAALPLLAWGAISAVTVFVLWPALWTGPAQAYAQLRTGVVAEGAEPHMQGNFFLGRPDDAPGLLFYPVALA